MYASPQGECRYEQELLPYFSANGDVMSDKIQKKKRQRSTKTNPRTASNKSKPSHKSLSDLECIDEETARGMDLIFTSVSNKQKPFVEHENEKPHEDIRGHAICPLQSNNDCPVTDVNDDCTVVIEDNTKAECTGRDALNLDNISQVITSIDEREPDLGEDVELQAMFYLPKWDLVAPSSTKLLPGRDEGLKAILANVAELLSRSPPLLTVDLDAAMASPSHPPSPQRVQGLLQPFQVSFALDMDNDDDDDEIMMSGADDADGCLVEKEDNKIYHNKQSVSRGSTAANSPTWDEVFDDEEERESHDGMEIDDEKGNDVMKQQASEEADKSGGKETENYWEDVRDDVMNESMDLFEDDEAFLQMTIPEIPTPENSVIPRTPPSAEDNVKSTKHMLKTSDTCTLTNPCSTTDSTNIHLTQDTITHNITESEHHTHTAAPNKHATENAESSDNSHDYFPVNFDLGYTLEDSDEEEEDVVVIPAPCTATSPHPKKQADPTVSLPGVSKSSTPYNSFHRPKHYSECKLSTSESTLEHRKKEMSSLLTSPLASKDDPLPSPITSPEARWRLTSGPAGPRTPSTPSILKRRRPECWTAEAETGPDMEKSPRQEIVFVSDFSLHPGLFSLQ